MENEYKLYIVGQLNSKNLQLVFILFLCQTCNTLLSLRYSDLPGDYLNTKFPVHC